VKARAIVAVVGLVAMALTGPSAGSADDSRVNDAKEQVKSGAKETGHGIAETSKGIGHTVAEGAKTTGEKVKEAGEAAKPEAKSAWQHMRDGAIAFGHSVRDFFSR